MKQDPLKPTASVLSKLGSIVVHLEEMMDQSKGHPFDKIALDQLLKDPELIEWLEQMQKYALLPVKR